MVIARFLLLVFITSAVHAGQLGIDNHDISEIDISVLDEIKASADSARINALNAESFDWVIDDEKKAAGIAVDEHKSPEIKKVESNQGVNFVIYVSWSLGDAFIKSLIEEHFSSNNVVLKFRGIPDGATMIEGLSRIQRISQDTKSAVKVELDPVSFQDNGVALVPAVIRFHDGKRVGIAYGTASIDVFKDKENRSDLGVLGSQVAIAEKDMIELMKERAAKINWQDKKNKAIKRFWANQSFVDLIEAPEHRFRRLDPTVVVPVDLKTQDGQMIHAAGTRINPLSIRPFNQRLVVIDPSKKWQLTLARDQIDRFGRNQLVTIVMTSLDRDTAWEDLKDIEKMLDQPAYILPSDVKERFDLEFVPAVVTADKTMFFIEEFAKRDQK
jgi:conjugal transfer pilus assembly protein TraW